MGLPGGCGLMADMCVLGMVRSSRRLTACDVVVGTSLCSSMTSSNNLRWTVDGASPQFLDRVVDISGMLRDKYAQCSTVLFWTG